MMKVKTMGTYQALHEAGLKVPDDISIVSFDDDDLASYLRPGLTTARLPYKEMGQKAMELVLADTHEIGRHLMPMPLQQRGSTSSPPVTSKAHRR
jgi:LacI family transcriptional regulator